MLAAVRHITWFSSTNQGFMALSLLLIAGSAISLIAVHFLDRGVNPVSMAVSDYGARRYAWFYRLAAIWLGLSGLLTAVVLADGIFPRPTLTILALLIFAATRWAITIFPTDIEGAEQTQAGRAHLVLAVAAFSAIAVAGVAFAAETNTDPFWEAHGALLTALGWALVVGAVLSGITRTFIPQVFGLVERLFYLCMFAWLATVALMVMGV
jgi:hypothetical protein